MQHESEHFRKGCNQNQFTKRIRINLLFFAIRQFVLVMGKQNGFWHEITSMSINSNEQH